jgi:hypothetical protein
VKVLQLAKSTGDSISGVCAGFKIKRSAAKYWCGEEYESLAAANIDVRQLRRENRLAENEKIFRAAVIELHSSGAGFSRRRIEQQLKLSRRSLLQPEMRALYQDAIENPDDYLPPKIRTANLNGKPRNKKSKSTPE